MNSSNFMDGYFGNNPSAYMSRQATLHLISKSRSNAALYRACAGAHRGAGRKPTHGAKIDARHMDGTYLKDTSIKDHLRTDIYKGQFYNKEFAFALNALNSVRSD